MAEVEAFHAIVERDYVDGGDNTLQVRRGDVLRIVEIDARNPQVAARMALPMTRMANYDAARQGMIRSALAVIQAGAGSNDLKEVVEKAL